MEFGECCTNEKRNWKAFIEERERNSLLVAAFEEVISNTQFCQKRSPKKSVSENLFGFIRSTPRNLL